MILFQISHEPLQFNLCVESRSSNIDVYEIKDERRNEGADKSPAGADSGIEQKSQQRFTVDVSSYFNTALSLTLSWFPSSLWACGCTEQVWLWGTRWLWTRRLIKWCFLEQKRLKQKPQGLLAKGIVIIKEIYFPFCLQRLGQFWFVVKC